MFNLVHDHLGVPLQMRRCRLRSEVHKNVFPSYTSRRFCFFALWIGDRVCFPPPI